MTYTSKVQLAFYVALVIFICVQSDFILAENENSTETIIELKSLKINQQINLNRIFKSTEKSVERKASIVSTSEQPVSVQLVGTIILGKKKVAWLKVENQVYQLESGQSIPGMKRQISQINPESVVLIYPAPCKTVESCDSPLTLTIRDALF